MLPINCGSHKDYQNFVVTNLRKYYPNPDTIPKNVWDIIERFWSLDLSFTDEFLKSKYSKFGPVPRTPSCMQRSYLLSIDFKISSITEWVSQLRVNPLFAILSGFDVGNTPGIGTFYDFLDRLWDCDENNLSSHTHKLKTPVKKPKRKGYKASSVEKITVDQLIDELDKTSFIIDDQPYSSLLKIYSEEFLNKSIDKGLINASSLSIAGDGTPIVTSARERKHRVCNCSEKGIHDCDCDRYFSQPDTDIGWDSSRGCFFNGYDLYMMVASESESDLPIFPLLNPASMHDSHGFLNSFFRMKSFLPNLTVNKVQLDSAHDAMPYYVYFKKNSIVPFIDLNEKRGIKLPYKNDFTLDKHGIPTCMAGLKMRHDGIEKAKNRIKFRCPLADRKNGCTCEHPCSNSKYGRTVHLQMKDNPRLINIPPRDSDAWKREYNKRTSAERSNKREKIDFKLEDGRHRSTKMWYCRLYHILMLQHLDAWDLPFESTLRKLVLNIA